MPIMQAMNVTLKTAIMSSPDDGGGVKTNPEDVTPIGTPTRLYR